MQRKYYFTDGSGVMPFQGGWTEVFADDVEKAIAAFQIYHPNKNGCINCCCVYPQEEFERGDMFKNGNFGKKCWEVICLEHKQAANSEGE